MFERTQDAGLQLSKQPQPAPRVPRHSGGWAFLLKRLKAEPGLRVLDIGPTSASNINFLTDLGHSVYLADLAHDAYESNWLTEKDEDGNPTWNVQGYLDQALDLAGRTFDIVLLWTALDYLPEAFVAPVVERLYENVAPDGQVLAFFHTRMSGEEAVHCRFHLSPEDDVLVQLSAPYPIQRAFTNRSVERLFSAWSGQKCFLAKDSVSEVLVTR